MSPGAKPSEPSFVLFWCWVILRHDIEFLPMLCPYVLPLSLFTEPRVDKAWPGKLEEDSGAVGTAHMFIFSGQQQ